MIQNWLHNNEQLDLTVGVNDIIVDAPQELLREYAAMASTNTPVVMVGGLHAPTGWTQGTQGRALIRLSRIDHLGK